MLTPDERRHKLTEILDAHNEAANVYRNKAIDAALTGMRATIDAMQQALAAQDEAVAAMLRANAAALALYNDQQEEK